MRRLTLSLFFWFFAFSGFAVNTDSLLQALPSLPNDTGKVNILLQLTWEYKYKDTDSAKAFLVTAEEIVRKVKHDKSLANVIYYQAILAYLEGDFGTAKKILSEALEVHQRIEDDYGLASVYNLLGLLNTALAEYEEAVENYIASLRLGEKTGDLYGISNPNHNIGIVYEKDKQYKQALSFYRKALNIRKQIGNEDFIAQSYSAIGGVFTYMQEYDSARFYLDKALAKFRDNDNLYMSAQSLVNLGLAYLEEGNPKEALPYFSEAEVLNEKVQNDETSVVIAVNKSSALHQLGKHQQAIAIAMKGVFQAFEVKSDFNRQKLLLTISESYEALKEYPKAIQFYNRYIDLSDTLYTVGRSEKIAMLEKKYETEKKEKEILKLSEKNLENELALNESKIRVLYLSAFLVAFLVIGSGYFLLYKQRQKTQTAQLLLQEQQRGFKAIIEAQEEERNRIARELHDGVVQSLAGIKMKLEQVSKANADSDLVKLVSYTDDTCDELRNISHQMMPKALKELTLKEALEDLVQKSARMYAPVAMHFDFMGDWKPLEKATEISLYRITQELINNAVKYAEASKIEVLLTLTQHRLLLTVEDNGKGFEVDHSTDGIGLENIKTRAALIQGRFNIESTLGEGTVARVVVSTKDLLFA